MHALARAKINLYLELTGRRGDGYHLLDSLVVFAEIADHLRVEPADDLRLTIDGPFASALIATADDNILLKAARLLAAKAGLDARAHMILEKNLPVAAGIGGGSADAAAALHGLCALWNLSLKSQDLIDIAAQLGADVPVCLSGRASIMQGIGDRLKPVELLPDLWCVLVNPNIALSTQSVFKARSGDFIPSPTLSSTLPSTLDDFIQYVRQRRNDLQEAAIGLVPEIGLVIKALESTPHCLLARMSGSGATCFGLYDTAESAHNAARIVARSYPQWWSVATKLVYAPQG